MHRYRMNCDYDIVRIPIDEDVYWKLKEMKVKTKAKNWSEFFRRVCKVIEEERLIEKLKIKKKDKRYTNFEL